MGCLTCTDSFRGGVQASVMAKNLSMSGVATDPRAREIKSLRDMAERCRKMAEQSRRPGPLMARALAFEESTLALEGNVRLAEQVVE